MKGKYLITTDNWFVAPDGEQYLSAWGEVEILNDSILGVKTNSRSANWFAKIGSEQNHVIVAGCQIHYAVKCDKKPNIKNTTTTENWHEGNIVKDKSAITRIYIAE